MDYLFTPAAERVLQHAAGWIDPAQSTELDTRSLLLGLLTETECRAAHLMAQHCVSMQEICGKWGILKRSNFTPKVIAPPFRLEDDLNHALREVYQFALEFERSPILATEHLLLAILYSDSESAQWLTERGLNRQSLEADIRAQNGYVNVPLEIDLDEEEECKKGEGGRGKGEEELDCKLDIANFKLQIEQDQLTVNNDQQSTTNDPRNPHSSFPLPPSSALRILDAAANRAREGLRVIEDFLRFVLDDRFLTATTKQLRHDLVTEIKKIPAADLLASRETQADVGTGLTSAAEAVRGDTADVLAANFGRLEESLRSLEEYGKLIDPAMAAGFKQIRYRIYTLERAVEITRQSAGRLAEAKLYVLIDGRGSLDEFRDFASALISAGVHVLQLRDKKLDDRELLERARALRELIRNACGAGVSPAQAAGTAAPQNHEVVIGQPLFIMNDRPDLALLSQADGVHLGQEELSVKDARTILGPQPLIGVSTHSIEQARQAVLDGANYIGVGPTFPSTTKEFANFPGLDLLRQVASEIRLPAFAIGGITLENLPEVVATGIGRVAVSSVITTANAPEDMVKYILGKV
jgi:thiamine-phosphate pyrophosphorylase